VNQQCSDEYSMFQVFCAEEWSAMGGCEVLPLFDTDCGEDRATCELICTSDVRNLDRQCGAQVQPFCVSGTNVCYCLLESYVYYVRT